MEYKKIIVDGEETEIIIELKEDYKNDIILNSNFPKETEELEKTLEFEVLKDE